VDPGPNDALFVLSLDRDGNYLWDEVYFVTGTALPKAIAVDSSGNIVATGGFTGSVDFGGVSHSSDTGTDVFVLGLTSDGTYRWDHTYGGPTLAVAADLTIDGAGNASVTGAFTSPTDFGSGLEDPGSERWTFLLSLDAEGNHRWARTFAGSFVAGHGVAADDEGNTFAVGTFTDSINIDGRMRASAGDRDVFLVSFDQDGTYRWDRTFGGTGSDQGMATAYSGRDRLVAVGSFSSPIDFGNGIRTPTGTDLFVLDLDTDGNRHWDRHFDGRSELVGRAVTVDSSRSTFVTGFYTGEVDFGGGLRTGANRGFLFKLRDDGTYAWDQVWASTTSSAGHSVTVDALGEVHVAGSYVGTIDFGVGSHTTTSRSGFILSITQ